MGKFCSYCGKDISETGVCDCEESKLAAEQAASAPATATAAPAEPSQADQYKAMAKNAFSKMGDLFVSFFKAPVETLRRAAHPDNMVAGILFYVIKSLLLALCVAIFYGRIANTMSGFYSIGFGSIVWTFFKVLLITLIGDAAMLGLLFGAAKLFKGKGDFRALVASTGTASIVFSCGFIVSALFLWLLPTVGLAFLVTMSVATTLFNAKAFAVTMEIQEDLRFCAILCANFVYFLVFSLILSSYLSSILGSLMMSSMF